MKRRKPVAFRIDQTLIDAPDFPRPVSWWVGFLPAWVSIVIEQPDGSIFVAVDGQDRADSLARIITQGPAGKRLAPGVSLAEAPATVPASRAPAHPAQSDETAVKQAMREVTRVFQRYTSEHRADRAASHRLGPRQRVSVGEYYFTHPAVPGRAFTTARQAAAAAVKATQPATGDPDLFAQLALTYGGTA